MNPEEVASTFSKFCKATVNEEEQIAHKLLGKQFQVQDWFVHPLHLCHVAVKWRHSPVQKNCTGCVFLFFPAYQIFCLFQAQIDMLRQAIGSFLYDDKVHQVSVFVPFNRIFSRNCLALLRTKNRSCMDRLCVSVVHSRRLSISDCADRNQRSRNRNKVSCCSSMREGHEVCLFSQRYQC